MRNTAVDGTADVDTQTVPNELSTLEFDSLIGMSLADAMREGSKETAQAYGWGDGVSTACALTAAGIVVNGKGYQPNGKK